MKVTSLSHEWDLLGKDDPMWRVASVPGKRGKWTPEEFFATGREQVADLLSRLGTSVDTGGEALDFGCGVGRLTQALADRFRAVTGVDISSSMLAEARRLSTKANVTYVQNESATLPFPEDRFSFVLSWITLQHVSTALALGYVQEFVRVTRPGGIIVFQVPTRWDWRSAGLRGSFEHAVPKRLLLAYHHLRYPGVGFSWVWGVPKRKLKTVLQGTESLQEEDTPPGRGWVSTTYCLKKRGPPSD